MLAEPTAERGREMPTCSASRTKAARCASARANSAAVGSLSSRTVPLIWMLRYVVGRLKVAFPDGELHPVNDIVGALESGGFEIRDVESLREHYPLTLRRWVANLAANRDEAVGEIGEERERVWRVDMLGSAQGFASGEIGVYQTLASRADAAHALPLDRVGLTALETGSQERISE